MNPNQIIINLTERFSALTLKIETQLKSIDKEIKIAFLFSKKEPFKCYYYWSILHLRPNCPEMEKTITKGWIHTDEQGKIYSGPRSPGARKL